MDSRGMLAIMYIKNGDKEQRKAAGVYSKYNQMIVIKHNDLRYLLCIPFALRCTLPLNLR